MSGSIGRQLPDEVHPVLTDGILQRPGPEIGPVVADQVWVVAVLKTGLLDLRYQFLLLPRIKDVDEAETPPIGAIRRDGDVVTTFHVGHIALQFIRAPIPVGIEPEILAGPRGRAVVGP